MAAIESQLYKKVLNKNKSRCIQPLLEPLLATGFSVRIALHSHCNDPSLEDPIPQEYVLYLCPTGPLNDILMEFWTESKHQCGKNKAHEIFPHITLSEFFTCEDQKVDGLYEALKRAGNQFSSSFPMMISLSLHSSGTYIGFFVSDGPANILKSFATTFATEATVLADCCVKPSTKQLHLTLAHKFYPPHQKTLEQLAKSINPKQCCQWVAALYARDMRFVHYQVLRALFQYKPQNIDELMLNAGDLIYVDRSQQNNVCDGWTIGTSHRTGCRGFLPENYTENANESETWVKHREYIFNIAAEQLPKNQTKPCLNVKIANQMPRNVAKMLAQQMSAQTATQRHLLVICHGERVDQVFGKSWLQRCFGPDGKYYRRDLNFPSSLPNRNDNIRNYKYDPPLSCCGIFQSRLTGEALLEKEVIVDCVYSSPALRCIQTAQHILEGLRIEQKVKIRIEPGLFEWTNWEESTAALSFMTQKELTEFNYSIDSAYKCNFPSSSLMTSEVYEDYIKRCSTSIKQIVDTCGTEGTMLIIGHCSSLDSITRTLLGLPARESGDFAQFAQKIHSLAMCFFKEIKEEKRWQMVNPPVEMLTHGSNIPFNWKYILLDN